MLTRSGDGIYDKIIIGAGLYGLYSALSCGRRGEKVLVLEYERSSFSRATHINQARVHMGYHYPRSYATAVKSAGYFHSEFDQIYATSSNFSWTSAAQFRRFCDATRIFCDDVNPGKYFNSDMCDGAFLTQEYAYDSEILKQYYLDTISKFANIEIRYASRIDRIIRHRDYFRISLATGEHYCSGYVLNATYASTNQILSKLGYEPLKIKYELCEMILCHVGEKLRNVGITVMDGPFFSIMPFGKTGMHSLTSVTFTPHKTSYDRLPTFECQQHSGGYCSPGQLGNCNSCLAKPETAWIYMSSMARKYLKDEYSFDYAGSLYSMKPIFMASEIDDSRPTVIKQYSSQPAFISVLSGKINTVYDLDEVLLT
jgi:hypothetical protein